MIRITIRLNLFRQLSIASLRISVNKRINLALLFKMLATYLQISWLINIKTKPEWVILPEHDVNASVHC